jgi:vacuolar-type H+-ATPase catalytic subunit A/Vma1
VPEDEKMVNIRMRPEDRALLQVYADQEGLSMSDVVRLHVKTLKRRLSPESMARLSALIVEMRSK